MKIEENLDIKVIFKELGVVIGKKVKIGNDLFNVEIIDNNKVLALMNHINKNGMYEILIDKNWYEISNKSYLIANKNWKDKKFNCCILRKVKNE